MILGMYVEEEKLKNWELAGFEINVGK